LRGIYPLRKPYKVVCAYPIITGNIMIRKIHLLSKGSLSTQMSKAVHTNINDASIRRANIASTDVGT
jgi:hypothetical protein